MSHDLIIEILKDLVGLVALGVGKMFYDVKKTRAELDVAFDKVRLLESRADAICARMKGLEDKPTDPHA